MRRRTPLILSRYSGLWIEPLGLQPLHPAGRPLPGCRPPIPTWSSWPDWRSGPGLIRNRMKPRASSVSTSGERDCCRYRWLSTTRGITPWKSIPGQTFLVDQQNNFWPVLDKRLAYDRVAKSAQPAAIGSSAASSGFLAGAAGALIGAAIGIVTGQECRELCPGRCGHRGGGRGHRRRGSGHRRPSGLPGNRRRFKDQVPGEPADQTHGTGQWFYLFPGRGLFRQGTSAAVPGDRQQPLPARGLAPLLNCQAGGALATRENSLTKADPTPGDTAEGGCATLRNSAFDVRCSFYIHTKAWRKVRRLDPGCNFRPESFGPRPLRCIRCA